MIKNKAALGICLTLLLGIGGCSRQQSDWEKTRAANTTDSYEQFLKKYPSGEFTAQAQARAKDLYEERDWQKARDTDTQEAYQAFLKQYPEGKWTEEARIRVENFSLAQAPSNAPAPGRPRRPPPRRSRRPPRRPRSQWRLRRYRPQNLRVRRVPTASSSGHSKRAPMQPTSAGPTWTRSTRSS